MGGSKSGVHGHSTSIDVNNACLDFYQQKIELQRFNSSHRQTKPLCKYMLYAHLITVSLLSTFKSVLLSATVSCHYRWNPPPSHHLHFIIHRPGWAHQSPLLITSTSSSSRHLHYLCLSLCFPDDVAIICSATYPFILPLFPLLFAHLSSFSFPSSCFSYRRLRLSLTALSALVGGTKGFYHSGNIHLTLSLWIYNGFSLRDTDNSLQLSEQRFSGSHNHLCLS